MMEQEIDLWPYLRALLKRWQLILGLIVACALVASGTALLTPPRTQATASVLIVPATSQVAFDAHFATRDATLLTNATYQRQALLGLASSTTLERRVAEQMGLQAQIESGELVGRVDVSTTGDLIQIEASGENDEEALALAEAWGRSYERLVAESYSRDAAGLAMIEEQISAASGRYGEAQRALEQFLGRSDIVQVEQQIKSLEGLLNGSAAAGTALYTQYLSRTQELDLLLSDARALRAQVAEGEADGLGSRLATLALRSRVAGKDVPVQLQIADADSFALSADEALADLDSLIIVVEDQRERIAGEAARLASAIAAGDGGLAGLDAATRQAYVEELATLRGRLAQLKGEEQALTQSRDIALDSLEILQRKRDEQQIAETTPLVSVRYLSTTIAPPSSALIQIALRGAVGALLGALLGSVVALWLEVLRPRLARVAEAPAERPAEKPATP